MFKKSMKIVCNEVARKIKADDKKDLYGNVESKNQIWDMFQITIMETEFNIFVPSIDEVVKFRVQK